MKRLRRSRSLLLVSATLIAVILLLIFNWPSCSAFAASSSTARTLPRLASISRSAGQEVALEEERKTSAAAASLTLAKTIMGSGVLSIPAGMMAFSQNRDYLLPAVYCLVVPLGLLSAYSFFLVGQVCAMTGEKSFGEAWGKLMGRRSGLAMAAMVAFECFCGCISYSMILGETLSLLVAGKLPMMLASRSSVICLLSALVIFPLTRLKDLNSLSSFSILGTFGVIYACAFTAFRYLQGAYAPGGQFYGIVPAVPLLPGGPTMKPNILLLASILATAYVAHFNAPRLYSELRSPSGGTEAKLKLFGMVSVGGFGLAVLLNTLVLVFGSLTFGAAVRGNVLDNYATGDFLAGIAKAAVALSVLFGYPLQFVGYTDSMQQLVGRLPSWFGPVSLAVITGIAVRAKDLGRFQAFLGALTGTLLVFIAPSIMAIVADQQNGRSGNTLRHASIATLGAVLAAAGMYVTSTG